MALPRAWWNRLFRPRPDDDRQAYCEEPEEFIDGNSVRLLQDGRQAYPAMLGAIAQAERTVHLETYVLKSDATGWAFARALAERARSSVQVRLIFDSVGSLDVEPPFLQFLRNNGIQLLEYRPIAPWRARWGWGKRDHRKILVVDGKTGFTGGINISDVYADPAEGGGGWRDVDVVLEGPAAHELDRLFRATWFRETGRWFLLGDEPTQTSGAAPVRVAANQEFLHRHRIRKAYRHALKAARRSVCIANPYFIPDRRIRRALYGACERGVSVKVMVPALEASDVPAVSYASRRLYDEHLRHGVRLFEWPGPVLHAKTVVVDDVWSAVGSYNMDHRSWLHNLEVNLHVLDRDFGKRMEECFERDLSYCREVTFERWVRRSRRERLLERAFHALRYWL